MRDRLFCRPVGGLVTGLVLASVLTGCGGSASAGGGGDTHSFLSGKGPGWYDGVRFLTYTESNGHLTGSLSAVVPEATAHGVVRVRYTLDGFTDGDTVTFTATADPANQASYLGGSGTWMAHRKGDALVLSIPGVGQDEEFRPASEGEFNRSAARATAVAVKEQAVSDANDTAGNAVDAVTAQAQQLAERSDYSDLLAEYDTDLGDAQTAVSKLHATGDCYYRSSLQYEQDSIADLDGRRLDAAASSINSAASTLGVAEETARGAEEALHQAIAALPSGVETTPRGTVPAEQVQTAIAAAEQQRTQATGALTAAQAHAARVRQQVQSLAAGADQAVAC